MQHPYDQLNKFPVELVHQKIARVQISKERLIQLVQQEACRVSGLSASHAVRFEVKFEDHNEGSPAYKTGTKCSVVIIEDQEKL